MAAQLPVNLVTLLNDPFMRSLAGVTVGTLFATPWVYSGAPVPGFGKLLGSKAEEAQDTPVDIIAEDEDIKIPIIPSPNTPPSEIFGHPNTVCFSGLNLSPYNTSDFRTIEQTPNATHSSPGDLVSIIIGGLIVYIIGTLLYPRFKKPQAQLPRGGIFVNYVEPCRALTLWNSRAVEESLFRHLVQKEDHSNAQHQQQLSILKKQQSQQLEELNELNTANERSALEHAEELAKIKGEKEEADRQHKTEIEKYEKDKAESDRLLEEARKQKEDANTQHQQELARQKAELDAMHKREKDRADRKHREELEVIKKQKAESDCLLEVSEKQKADAKSQHQQEVYELKQQNINSNIEHIRKFNQLKSEKGMSEHWYQNQLRECNRKYNLQIDGLQQKQESLKRTHDQEMAELRLQTETEVSDLRSRKDTQIRLLTTHKEQELGEKDKALKDLETQNAKHLEEINRLKNELGDLKAEKEQSEVQTLAEPQKEKDKPKAEHEEELQPSNAKSDKDVEITLGSIHDTPSFQSLPGVEELDSALEVAPEKLESKDAGELDGVLERSPPSAPKGPKNTPPTDAPKGPKHPSKGPDTKHQPLIFGKLPTISNQGNLPYSYGSFGDAFSRRPGSFDFANTWKEEQEAPQTVAGDTNGISSRATIIPTGPRSEKVLPWGGNPPNGSSPSSSLNGGDENAPPTATFTFNAPPTMLGNGVQKTKKPTRRSPRNSKKQRLAKEKARLEGAREQGQQDGHEMDREENQGGSQEEGRQQPE